MSSHVLPLNTHLSRRDMLRRCGAGFGTLGLATLLGDRSLFAADAASNATSASPLAPRPPHFRARAKYVIQNVGIKKQ